MGIGEGDSTAEDNTYNTKSDLESVVNLSSAKELEEKTA